MNISKSPTLIPAALACSLLSSAFAAAEGVREAPSAADIAALRGDVASSYGNSKTSEKSGVVTAAKKRASLSERSEFLIGAYGYTILPKGAVTHTGKAVQLSASQPGTGKLMDWDSFYRKHRGVLRLIPITDSQWTGKAPLESLKPTLDSAAESGLTALISLNGYPVGLPQIQTLLEPSK